MGGAVEEGRGLVWGVSLRVFRSVAGCVTLVCNGAIAQLTVPLDTRQHSLEAAHAHVAHARVLSTTGLEESTESNFEGPA